MHQEIVLFHSTLGLRPAVLDFADRLRAAGHTVHTPDLFEGALFDSLEEGMRRRDEIGMETLMGRAQEAIANLPQELVFAGFSMGAMPAELLAATRPGARAAILMHGAFAPAAFGIVAWPDVPVQLHYANGDPQVDPDGIHALESAVRATGAHAELYAYEGGGHLFEDAAFESHDAESAKAMQKRVLDFLARLEPNAGSGATPASPR
jgi:dienelactone hydrolase